MKNRSPKEICRLGTFSAAQRGGKVVLVLRLIASWLRLLAILVGFFLVQNTGLSRGSIHPAA